MNPDRSPDWKALTETMADGLIVVDGAGLIRYTNRAASELLQRTPQELVGHPLGFPAIEGESTTLNLLAREGRMLTAHLRAAEIEWDGAAACLIVVHDITELLQRQRQIEELNRRLAEQVTDLEQFSYMVAHDLRSPLRAICSYSHILQDDHAPRLAPEALHLTGRIQAKCAEMENLITGVLAFARSSVQPLAWVEVDLDALMREIVHSLEATGPGSPAEIKIDPLPTVCGDPLLLRQVFGNLLSNALKYAGVDRPEVKIWSSTQGESHRISVSDNGVGFSENDAKRIFNAFTRLRPEKPDGTGVGLSIVRNIVQRHGGKVWAEGGKEKGATFHVELPAACAS